MDVVHLVQLSSVTGAGLFFSAGFLARKAFPSKDASAELEAALRGEKTARQQAEELAGTQEKLAKAQAQQLGQLQQQLAALQRQRDDAARQLAEEKAQAAARVSALEAEAGQLRQAASAPRPAVNVAPLTDENARLRAQLSQASSEAEAYRAKLSQRDADLANIRAELASAQSLASTAEREVREAEAHAAQLKAAAGREKLLEQKIADLTARVSQSASAQAQLQQVTAQLAASQAKAKEAQQSVQQIAPLQTQLAAAQAKLKEAQQGVQQLAVAQAQVRQLEQQLVAVQERTAQLEQQIAAAQVQNQKSQALAQELMATRAQMRDLRAQVAEAEARAKEAVRLREENSALRAQAAEPSRGADSQVSMADVQRRNVELSLKARVLEQRSAEFEMQAAEIESLRFKVDQLQSLASETVVLRERVLDLEAVSFARKVVEGKGSVSRPSRTDGPTGLENQLERDLEVLVRGDTGCRTAVLADMRGLLIAATGDITYQDEIAAAASLTIYTTERLRQLVPMGEPASIRLVDVNHVALETRWLRWENDAFLLTTLGVAPDVHDQREEHVQKIISELLGT